MSIRITKAIATYQANTAPAAIRQAVRTAKHLGHGGLLTAAGFRSGAADELREVLAAEVAR
jgi:hypothetical protein